MSLAPHFKDRKFIQYPWACLDGKFTADELARIVEIGRHAPMMRARVNYGPDEVVDETKRRSNIAWLHPNDDPREIYNTRWLFDRLLDLTVQANDAFFQMDLRGFDQLQYTEYLSEEYGVLHTHIDLPFDVNVGFRLFRKLSFSILLNDDFEGGELSWTEDGQTQNKIEARKGRLIVFPSFVPHSVAPVTKGVRRSLVFWAHGPKYR